MPSSNPAFSAETFEQFKARSDATAFMTMDGAANKTAFLLAMVVLSGAFSWMLFLQQNALYGPVMIAGFVGGLIFAIATIFKKEWSPFTAPAYAIFEGLALGSISAFFNLAYDGIVFQALFLTMATLAFMLSLYKMRIIQVTEQFRFAVFAATGAIALIYLATFGLGLLGVKVPYINDNGIVGIGISLVIVAVAALNLALDFDFIEKGAQASAPKFMEWYAAFGLMVTLVWLYLEILRLLAKLSSRK